ncbi:hypothetical protein MRQ36_27345 [Micromonospora sp. R77]|uniref:hypothetical protein n=1 Tax=Micromonospora sp. R77 TaxID=2925836 RepID=UPI001F60E197|nr:hypothetical protein [Micromonospora sp. R77]MCI4066060.1 hypothetical protein [Micromonospora sp. R77]
MDLASCVDRVIELRTLDIAAQPLPPLGAPATGLVEDDFVALYLGVTAEFEDSTWMLEVLDRFEQDCVDLDQALSRRWGSAESVDLRPDMDRMLRGEPLPNLTGFLLTIMSGVAVWRFPDRSVCLGVGVWDTHGPVVLVAATGDL